MALFSHKPQVDEFSFQGFPVNVLRRPYQRSIGVAVKPNGLIKITAGKKTPQKIIDGYLNECGPWIEKVQGQYKELRKKYPSKLFVQGEPFLFKGQRRFLNYVPHSGKTIRLDSGSFDLNCLIPEYIWSDAFHILPQPQLQKQVLDFYRNQGRKVLASKVEAFSGQMNLYPKQVSYRSQKTRWGSCSSAGSISLNWRLIAAPEEVLEYVVIHELAHLRHQNHSKTFWALVEKHCPNWSEHRNWLRHHQYEFDFLAKTSELHRP